jgi:hypothetical protein
MPKQVISWQGWFRRKEILPKHTLITSESSDTLVELRAVFLAKLFSDLPEYRMAELSNTEFLKAIVYPRSTTALVAKYTYDVLEIFTPFLCFV